VESARLPWTKKQRAAEKNGPTTLTLFEGSGLLKEKRVGLGGKRRELRFRLKGESQRSREGEKPDNMDKKRKKGHLYKWPRANPRLI